MNENDPVAEAFAQQVVGLQRDIRDLLSRGNHLEEAISTLREKKSRELAPWPPALEMVQKAIGEAEKLVRAELDNVRYLRRAAIRSGRPDWYAGPNEEAGNWEAMKARLLQQGRTEDEVNNVDKESTVILSLMDNPGQLRFSTRGLVMGHVQSGKTGNMAAVIAKASDTPFKFFVVLSGMTDSLRNQTQARLDSDIVNCWKPEHWHNWTKIDKVEDGIVVEKGEFNHPNVGGFPFGGHKKHIAVVKKNAGILRRFLAKLKSTPEKVLQETPVLIIDDECDQASVNAAALNRAVTTINRLIREILQVLPRVTYVGYTATPFANVLIDPSSAEDLYPRHFIHPLSRPNAYFGAVELFGREAIEGENADVESGYDMIRLVPDDELRNLRPPPRKRDEFVFDVTESLGASIRYFILAVAAREVRGQGDDHCSMLVHTSMLNSVHRSAERAIRPHIERLAFGLRKNDPALIRELREQWELECDRVEASEFGLSPVSFDDIRSHLVSVADSIEVMVENWSSDDRIDYSQSARRYLIIGGNVLARGLTLHGLIVSFFVRSTSQYDTLMQMGRWFGYRKGFEDLPRIWMEVAVRDAFFDLATVEEEIRQDASRYAAEDFTPEQFAVRIRKIPGLAVTARSKMRNAVIAKIGYQGVHLQTIKFPRKDRDWLEANWKAASQLLESTDQHELIRGNHIFRGVDVEAIKKFLLAYNVEESNRTMIASLLIKYICEVEEHDSSLAVWNVVVVSKSDGPSSLLPLGPLESVRCVRRSPLKDSGNIASIKALMSRADLLADVETLPDNVASMKWDAIKKERRAHRQPPLLLLYPIDRNSKPEDVRSKRTREPMDAKADVMGLGILFPGDPDTSNEYIQADLQPEDVLENFEGEDALPLEVVDGALG